MSSSAKHNIPFSLSSDALVEFQPNRYPFLMIDFVSEVIPGKYSRGHKNLTLNEWYFPQHFPGNANMPGALQLGALAQMLTIAITTLPGLKGKVTHAISHKVNFKREVKPGERLDIYTEIQSWKRGICRGKGTGTVNGEVACKAEMVITIPEILEQFLPSTSKK